MTVKSLRGNLKNEAQETREVSEPERLSKRLPPLPAPGFPVLPVYKTFLLPNLSWALCFPKVTS